MSFIKYEHKPEKVQPQLNNVAVYDVEVFNTIKCVPYANCILRLGKHAGKYNRDVTQDNETFKNDCSFQRNYFCNELLDHVPTIKGELKKRDKNVE